MLRRAGSTDGARMRNGGPPVLTSGEAAPVETRIGIKIKEARLSQGMTQEHLAGDEYTKAFVSAVERDESGISDQALEVFARRLGMPVEHFRISHRGFDMAVAEVEQLIDAGHADQALQRLEALARAGTLQRGQEPQLRRWMGHAYLGLNRPAEALAILLQALADFSGLDNGIEIERTRLLLGTAYYMRGNLSEAIQSHQLCLQAVKDGRINDPSFALRVHTSLGNEHVALGHHDLAMTHYEEALRLSEQAQDLERLAVSHWGMSLAYKERGDLEAALTHARRALALYEVLGNRRLASQIQNNMGIVHAELGNWERARQCYERTLAEAEVSDDRAARAQALMNLVEYHSAVNDTATAISLLPAAEAAAESTGQTYYQVSALLRASATYQVAKQLDQAEGYARRAVEMAKDHDLQARYGDACFQLAGVLVAQDRVSDAVPYFTQAYGAARGAVHAPLSLR